MGGYVDGRSKHPLFGTWHQMIRRCHDPRAINWHLYGARGITVCDEWRESFWAFARAVGERPAGHQLDRIDNDGNYEPGNVRWATRSENLSNKRRNLAKRCPAGHDYSETGFIDNAGYRRCLTCKREQSAASARRRRQAAHAAGKASA